jgi:hypothetical protein
MQRQVLATVDPGLDLSPATPDGQFLGIYAAYSASLWELAQVVWNSYNRQDAEGAALDNLGDITGTPREGPDYTQVYALLALAPGTYPASTWDDSTGGTGALLTSTLLAGVSGATSQQFANVSEITPVSLEGTVDIANGNSYCLFTNPQTLPANALLVFASQPSEVYFTSSAVTASTTVFLTTSYTGTTASATTATPGTIALMQATAIGPTPTVNDNTLTIITTPLAGWSYINNPPLGSAPNSSQAQAGEAEEQDAAYALRQSQDVAGEGGCTAAACAAALNELGAAQVPPIALVVTVLENTTNAPLTVDGYTLPPHTYAPIIGAGLNTWPTSAAGMAAIAAVVYANKPPGITSFGTTGVTVVDPLLGPQLVSYTVPAPQPLYITVTVVPRAGVVFASLTSAIQSALVAAAITPTPATGIPPTGQLAPGTPVVSSQLEGVIVGVPGVFDVQSLFFGFSPSPTNTAPLLLAATGVATIDPTTANVNIVVLAGSYP